MSYPPLAPYGGAFPTGRQQMIGMIAATTDVTALVNTVAEAYRLTVSLDRDVAEIEAYYRRLEETDRQLHQQIMLALEGRFTERAAQIAFVERMVTQLIEHKQFDVAHSIVTQLMKLLQQSPVEEAFSQKRRDGPL
jgi:hypothetical protein